jgi:hypothetical protein
MIAITNEEHRQQEDQDHQETHHEELKQIVLAPVHLDKFSLIVCL